MEFKYKDIMGNLSKVEYMQDLFDLVGDSVDVYEVNRKIVDKGLGVTIGGDTYMVLLDILDYVNHLEKTGVSCGLSSRLVKGLRIRTQLHTSLDESLLLVFKDCSRLAFEGFDSNSELGMYVDLYRSFHKIATLRDPKGAFEALVGCKHPYTLDKFLEEDAAVQVRKDVDCHIVEVFSIYNAPYEFIVNIFECGDKALAYKRAIMDVVNAFVDGHTCHPKEASEGKRDSRLLLRLSSEDLLSLSNKSAVIKTLGISENVILVTLNDPKTGDTLNTLGVLPNKDLAVRYTEYLLNEVYLYEKGLLEPLEPTRTSFTSDHNTLVETPAGDLVHSPKHYDVFQGIEAKEIIECVLESGIAAHLTPYQCYCLGNVLKYRLRAGSKDNLEQDIAKADKYKEMGHQYE